MERFVIGLYHIAMLLLGHGGFSPLSLIFSQSLAHDEVAGIDHVGGRAVWPLASLTSSWEVQELVRERTIGSILAPG